MLQKIEITELAERLGELKEAIDVVHAAGIVINDISMSNIMLDKDTSCLIRMVI